MPGYNRYYSGGYRRNSYNNNNNYSYRNYNKYDNDSEYYKPRYGGYRRNYYNNDDSSSYDDDGSSNTLPSDNSSSEYEYKQPKTTIETDKRQLAKDIQSFKHSITDKGSYKIFISKEWRNLLNENGTPIDKLTEPWVPFWYVRIGSELKKLTYMEVINGSYQ